MDETDSVKCVETCFIAIKQPSLVKVLGVFEEDYLLSICLVYILYMLIRPTLIIVIWIFIHLLSFGHFFLIVIAKDIKGVRIAYYNMNFLNFFFLFWQFLFYIEV